MIWRGFNEQSGPARNGGKRVARRSNYGFEKKQREIKKQKKREKKAEKKRLKKELLDPDAPAEGGAETEEEPGVVPGGEDEGPDLGVGDVEVGVARQAGGPGGDHPVHGEAGQAQPRGEVADAL